MKQFSQIVRGVLLALVLFELIIWIGGKVDVLRALIGAFAVPIAALLLLLCLYLTFIRKGKRKAAAPVDRNEYLVTMEPNAYGRIGEVFDKTKYGDLERLPGGWLEGVRTYRADNGSLLFTVRKSGAPALRVPAGRAVAAVVLAFVLLGPLSALSYVNAANAGVGTLLGNIGLTEHPTGMAYLDVPSASLLWTGSDTTASSDKTEPTVTPTKPDTVQPDIVEPDSTTEDNTDTSVIGGITDTVGGWFTGARDWVSGFFGGNYILPSHRRALTDSDVAGMDATQIQRAINEMYARYGYDFTGSSNTADAAYFAAQSWYKPDPSVTLDDARAQFSDVEQQNLNFLIACRNRLRQ